MYEGYLKSPLFPGLIFLFNEGFNKGATLRLIASPSNPDPEVLKKIPFEKHVPTYEESFKTLRWEEDVHYSHILEELRAFGFYKTFPFQNGRFYHFQYNSPARADCFLYTWSHTLSRFKRSTDGNLYGQINTPYPALRNHLGNILSRFSPRMEKEAFYFDNVEDFSFLVEFLKQANFTLLQEDVIYST